MLVITFTPSGGSAYVLADGTSTGGVSRDVNIAMNRQVQVSPGLRWTTVKVLARFNQHMTVSFQVQHLFPNETAATLFMTTHVLSGVQLPASAGTLTFAMGGSNVSHVNNAVVQNVTSNQKGSSTFSQYTFLGTDAASG